MSEKDIYVYADWLEEPELIGTLHVSSGNGRERTSFEYDGSWLENHPDMMIDPEIYPCPGRQYPSDGKHMFGVFSDSCPDRWGRLLMRRREAMDARAEDRKPQKLLESDYLLGVYDETRMGAIRFALEPGGEFQSPDRRLAAPPWATLRELESASLAFENAQDPDEEKWLRQLLAPGSSLGGARPKANVKAPDGSLWIAKFPSKHDEWNAGAWEMVAHDLAKKCGLDVPEAKLLKFSNAGSTFLVRRFDREGERRIPFASAMVAEQVEFVDCCWTRLRTIQSAPLLNYRLYRQNTEEPGKPRLFLSASKASVSITLLAREHKRPLVFPPVVTACYERDVPTRNSRIQYHVRRIRPLCVPPTEISRIGERGALRLVGSRVDDLGEFDAQYMLFPRHLKQHLAVFLCESSIRVLGERREHRLVVHVVAEHHRSIRFEPLSLTACIEVRASVDVVLPVNVVMKIVLRIG